MAHESDNTPNGSPSFAPTIIIVALFAATLALFWNGVAANDSEKYGRAALSWLEAGPQLGRDHWALRLPLVAPIAAAFALFGVSELAATLPNIAFALLLILITHRFASDRLGKETAFAVACLLAVSPFFLVQQTELAIVGPEILPGALACWLFIAASERDFDRKRLFAAGLLSGAAWLCREVAIYLPVALGALLVFRRSPLFDRAIIFSLGFGAVIIVELAAYGLLTGDPFYRLAIDAGHRGEAGFYALSHEATLHPLLARFIVPFREFATAPAATPFVLFAAALLIAPPSRRVIFTARNRFALKIFLIAALLSFAISAFAVNLKRPEYYPILIYAAVLVAGAFVGGLIRTGKTRYGAGVLAALIALSWMIADFRRYDEYAEARRLAAYAETQTAQVLTDQVTAIRTRFILRLRGLSQDEAARRIQSTKDRTTAPCGLVYSATPKADMPAIAPREDWRLLWREHVRKRRWTTEAILALTPSSMRPALRRQFNMAGPVALYDAGACAPASDETPTP